MEEMVSEIVGVDDENVKWKNDIDETNELIAQYSNDLADAEQKVYRMEQARKNIRLGNKENFIERDYEEKIKQERMSLK